MNGDIQQEIQHPIDAGGAAWEAKREAARAYIAFRVREGGTDAFFRLEQSETFLEVAKFLRHYLRDGQETALAVLQRSAFAGMEPIIAEQYGQMLALRMEAPEKVTGVFDLDFDKREVSCADASDGWRTYSMEAAASAVWHAYQKSDLTPEAYENRFAEGLAGSQITSSGHLSERDISLADEICEMDGQRLNFYLESSFDVDVVFGTHVCTEENDDTLNIYANYDMAAGQVCNELEVELHRADGRVESLEYRLNAVEKAVLLRKMDAYCQQQTGQTLAGYSAQLLAGEMATPTQPTM